MVFSWTILLDSFKDMRDTVDSAYSGHLGTCKIPDLHFVATIRRLAHIYLDIYYKRGLLYILN